MENFIDELWTAYSTTEAMLLPEIQDETVWTDLWDLLRKKILELKIFVMDYKWKNSEEQCHFMYRQAPLFCNSFVFLLQAKNYFASQGLLSEKGFRKSLRNKKRVMEDFCRQAQPFVSHCRFLESQNVIVHPKQRFPQWEIYPLGDEQYYIEDNSIFSWASVIIGKFEAYKNILKLFSEGVSSQQNTGFADFGQRLKGKDTTGLQWTETGMSLTEIAYALKYSGAINKGNVNVREIAEVLGRTFNIKPVNVYRNKQDFYTRKNQSLFLDRLRKDFIKGLEESDSI